MATSSSVQWRPRTVVSNGVALAVFELGDAARPSVVLVHGWPDTHALWTDVAPTLAERFHVVAYDTRGYGASDSPAGDAPYELDKLATDLCAVIDAVADGHAHVLAHDWGSVQTWEAVTTPGAHERIDSFTSVSGPNLDQLSTWARAMLTRPTPSNIGAALSQVISSAYTGIFQTPVLPKVLFSLVGYPAIWKQFLHRIEGTDPARLHCGPTLHKDMISGLRYYRANIRQRLAHPNPRSTDVPVFEIVNRRDIALRPAIYDYTHRYARSLWRIDLASGHWLPYGNPRLLAQLASEFVESIESGSATPTISRAVVSGKRGSLQGQLSIVTGAGSGIGRETAKLFARQGSHVVVADINKQSASETADLIADQGGTAYAYALDVTSDDEFAEFAETVMREHGVPDIVVNNAGIGLAGSLLKASDAQVRKLIDVNLVGVITGCRVFGAQMVERGAGGHIVNLSSAAAFTPQAGLGVYAASKAGVLLLSESLRGELSRHHIGVSAICPGIVDTNIVSTTEFAGTTPEQQHARQQKMDGLYRKRGYTPDRVAHKILSAVVNNRPVVPVTAEAQTGYFTYRFTPAVSRRLAKLQGL